MASLFGCIVAGRLVQTNFIQSSESKFLIQLENAQEINHLVVFMTGVAPFPVGFAATVHFYWPTETNPHWQLLGYLSNEKPSAIFKLGGTKSTSSTTFLNSNNSGTTQGNQMNLIVAQLGISIEPVQQVMVQCSPASPSIPSTTSAVTVLNKANESTTIAVKLLQNLADFCSGFVVNQLPPASYSMMQGSNEDGYIPMKVCFAV